MATRKLIDAVNERLGLSTFITPLLHEIRFVLWPSKEAQSLDFDTFFARMPPFEPISIFESEYGDKSSGKIRIKGDYVWFILSIKKLVNKDEIRRIFRKFGRSLQVEYNERVRCDEIICGIYEDQGDRIILEEVIIPRVVYGGEQLLYKEVNFEIGPKQPKLVIYYGFHKIAKTAAKEIKGQSNIVDIIDVLKKYLQPLEEGKGYSPWTLNYVTSCYDGYIITTDPTARNEICDPCEKEKRRYLCREYPGLGKYEYRRRIFPKAYSNVSIELSSDASDVIDECYLLPYVVMVMENVGLFKDINGFVMYLDRVGKVELELEKKISTGFFNSNVFLTAFDISLLKTFISVLENSKDNISIIVRFGPHRSEYRIPSYNLLISKYLWRRIFDGSLKIQLKINEQNDSIDIVLEKLGDRPLNLVNNFRDVIEGIKSEFIQDLENFLVETITHTLAHAIYIAMTKYVPEGQPYIDYLHAKLGQYVLAGVFENTKNGMLRLSQEFAIRLTEHSTVSSRNGTIIPDPRILKTIIESALEGHKYIIESGVTSTHGDYAEELKNTCSLVVDKIQSEIRKSLNQSEENIVCEVVKDFYKLLYNTIEGLIKSGIYIDSQMLTYSILWYLMRNPDIIIDHLIKKLSKRYKSLTVNELVNLTIESLFETELYKIIIELLFPDLCTDGCSFDLHLPDCHEYLEQPFIVSRSLLLAFLEFLGVGIDDLKSKNIIIERLECPGSQLRNLCLLTRRSLYALTSEFSGESLNLVKYLLSKNPRLKITLEIDKRLMENKPEIIDNLRRLASESHGRLELKITESPHHGKMVELDNLKIHTSWNFGTSVLPLQTYKTELKVRH